MPCGRTSPVRSSSAVTFSRCDPMTETKRYRWNDLEVEQVSDAMRRRLISGERIMLAQVLLSKGALSARRQHVHEQMAYIVAGRLRFKVGDGNEEITVGAGEVLHF